jgi:hypothetical protein
MIAGEQRHNSAPEWKKKWKIINKGMILTFIPTGGRGLTK